MDYRTPVSRARGLGAAKEGVAHWWAQRLTAVALVPLLLWLTVSLLALADAGYTEVIAWVRQPVVTVLLLVTLGVAFHHGQLGLQIIIEDYVHGEALKLISLMLIKFAAVLLAVSAGYSVLRIAFGG